MPKLQGLIFDLDGTLVDSAPDLRQALNRTLAEQGRRGLELNEIKTFLGDGMLTMLQRAFAVTGASLSDNDAYRVFQSFVAHYRSLPADTAQIYPHVTETLAAYRQQGVKIGLCTNKQEASTVRLMDELKLSSYFHAMAGGDTFPVHKPHPGHVTGVIAKMQVPTEGCVMIGDSINDIRAAKGAGIPCLVVTHGYGMDVEELGADGLIGGINELKTALHKLGFS